MIRVHALRKSRSRAMAVVLGMTMVSLVPVPAGAGDGRVVAGDWSGAFSALAVYGFPVADGRIATTLTAGGPLAFTVTDGGRVQGTWSIDGFVISRVSITGVEPFSTTTNLRANGVIGGAGSGLTLTVQGGGVGPVAFGLATVDMPLTFATCDYVAGTWGVVEGAQRAAALASGSVSASGTWYAFRRASPEDAERAATIERLEFTLREVLSVVATPGGVLDRREFTRIIGEMERVQESLRDARRCVGRNWGTPFAGVIMQFLEAIANGRIDVRAQDLQTLIEGGLRTGAFVDAPPEFEGLVVGVLRVKLTAARAARDANAAEAVGIAAALLGEGALAAEAFEAERSFR